MKNILIWIVILLLTIELQAQHLVINEICAKNQNVLSDYEGDFPDWIELYNGTDTTINLLGYRLSDNNDSDPSWLIPIPILLAPDSFLLVFASGKDDFVNAEFHTDFSISSSGETISLLASDNTIIDLVESPEIDADQSYGRVIDGENDWLFFSQPTPGISNGLGLPLYNISFSHPQGFYDDSLFLTITTELGLDIRFTTDGRKPVATDSLYTDPLLLKDKSIQPNMFSTIPSTFDPYVPIDTIDKFNVLRIAAFLGNSRVTPIYNRTYAIGEKPLLDQFPVVSIIVEPDDFFGDSLGIWVNGSSYYNGGPPNYSKLGKEWERPISLAFFDENKVFEREQGAGIRTHGNGLRNGAHKSLRLYGRKEYGDTYLTHSLIEGEEDNYKRLLLRTVRFNRNKTYFADEFGYECLKKNQVFGQKYRIVVAYINGEYWGIYGLKTRIDEFHLEETFDVDKDEVDLIFVNESNIKAGDAVDFENLQAFLDTADLSIEEQYLYLNTLVDVDNYMNYLISLFYIDNTDWPGNNHYLFKEKNDSALWKWIGVDSDFAFINPNTNSIGEFLESSTLPNPINITRLGSRLFENEQFTNNFVSAFEDRLNTIYRPDSLVPIILEYYNLYKPHFISYLNRFNYTQENSMQFWETKVNGVIDFVSYRPCAIKEHLLLEFGQEINIPECELYVVDTTVFEPEISFPLVTQSPDNGSVPEVVYYDSVIRDTEEILGGSPSLKSLKWYFRNGWLNFDESSFSINGVLGILVYDVNGKEVFSKKINSATPISLLDLPKGIYIIQTQAVDAVYYQKIFLGTRS